MPNEIPTLKASKINFIKVGIRSKKAHNLHDFDILLLFLRTR